MQLNRRRLLRDFTTQNYDNQSLLVSNCLIITTSHCWCQIVLICKREQSLCGDVGHQYFVLMKIITQPVMPEISHAPEQAGPDLSKILSLDF